MSRYNMLAAGARVIAAVSGGPDSTCLLHVLRELAPARAFSLAGVAHFNHQLRGDESEQDERFVAQLAASMSLPLHRACGPAERGGNLEQALGRARRKFFRELIQSGAATHIALGHTRDDQAETVLFRLLRGSGLTGLAGILPVTADGFVRPLLGSTRAEVLEFLRARGIAWREDSSNADARFARNRIRRKLLPALARDWNPNLAAHLSQLGELAYHEELWWQAKMAELARGMVTERPGAVEFSADHIAGLATAPLRRFLRHAIGRAKGNLEGVEFAHIERLVDLVRSPAGNGSVDLLGARVLRSFDWIRIEGKGTVPSVPPPRIVRVPGKYPSPDGKSLILLEVIELTRNSPCYATLKMDLIPSHLELRGWRPGDRYRPVGLGRDRKLQEMFQRARVPSWRRSVWPILSLGDRIVWTRDFGPAEEFAAKASEAPKSVVRVQERPGDESFGGDSSSYL